MKEEAKKKVSHAKQESIRGFNVQFEMPVDNPENNVRIKRRGRVITFYVPCNYPDAHSVGLAELLIRAQQSGLIHLSTSHNNNTGFPTVNVPVVKDVNNPDPAESGRPF